MIHLLWTFFGVSSPTDAVYIKVSVELHRCTSRNRKHHYLYHIFLIVLNIFYNIHYYEKFETILSLNDRPGTKKIESITKILKNRKERNLLDDKTPGPFWKIWFFHSLPLFICESVTHGLQKLVVGKNTTFCKKDAPFHIDYHVDDEHVTHSLF